MSITFFCFQQDINDEGDSSIIGTVKDVHNWLVYRVIDDGITCYAHFHNAFFSTFGSE